MGIKDIIKRAADNAAGGVSKLSSLSSAEIGKIQESRENYLLDKPDLDSDKLTELTGRFLAANSVEIFNAYLPQIKDLYLPVDNATEYDGKDFDLDYNVRYLNITKWVNDSKEDPLKKLANVYAVLANEECNIALIFNRVPSHTNVYLAVVNTKNESTNTHVDNYVDRLKSAVQGNFPGSELSDVDIADARGFSWVKENTEYSVACVSNIPTEKSENFQSQTIEKLLDGIVPQNPDEEYTIILLATPILDVEERKVKLGEFYDGLAPFATWQKDYHFTDTQAVGSVATVGVNLGASAGIQNGRNFSSSDIHSNADSEAKTESSTESDAIQNGEGAGEQTSESEQQGDSITDSTGHTETDSQGNSQVTGQSKGDSQVNTNGHSAGAGAHAEVGVPGIGGGGSVHVGKHDSISTGKTHADVTSIAENATHASGNSTGKAIGKQFLHSTGKSLAKNIFSSETRTLGQGISNTVGRAVTNAMAKTSGVAKSLSLGANFGANFARSSSVTAIIGKNEGVVQNYTNFNIKHALKLLDIQTERLEQSSSLGLWDFAAYVLSKKQHIANNVARTYLALTMGEKSYMSHASVNLWRGNLEEEKDIAKTVCSYVKQLRHPIFALNPNILDETPTFNVYPSLVTPTTSLSGLELSYSLNFPQKPVSGLPVLECASFGRNVVTYDIEGLRKPDLKLGQIFHMNNMEKCAVNLSLDSLKSHVFVTGSTGSGKSNTVQLMLQRAKEQGVKFLVIEPAKGEYKNVFCGDDRDNVDVYGTNPSLTPLLRINPFKFPQNIHVLEHLDRLVEIFNACWPMYAAMPAVLKNAIEKSYIDCGWDLTTSSNKYDICLYPTFTDVASNVKAFVDSSEYDAQNKGAYKGALLTRLQSLTTGVYRQIFSADEISDEDLFENNVIIDLSRVGAMETKSLIMGLLMLRLQEYRMSNVEQMNSDLRHLTVLEEAHNLLRRTSVDQFTESANILGKSVEMLSNAIAEMRSYGEGFIIADQAPGLLDMSVIRNTNTKIVMRLPDLGDRELVGNAANLDDDQIRELAKLPCGVAAVYQNEWVQPVLCKVDLLESESDHFEYKPDLSKITSQKDGDSANELLKCVIKHFFSRESDTNAIRNTLDNVIKSDIATQVKIDLLEYIKSDRATRKRALGALLYDLLDARSIIESSKQYLTNIHDWVTSVKENLKHSIKDGVTERQLSLVIMLILSEQHHRDISYKNVLNSYLEIYRRNGGVI